MKKNVQWETEISINAPIKKVWDATQDISLISAYHPEVGNVELISGQAKRGPGVEYKCVVPEGPRKGSCIERVLENVKYKKTTTLAVEDTWGLDKMLKNNIVDLMFEENGENKTILRFLGYYEPIGLKIKILNVILLRRKMRNRGNEVLMGLKDIVEKNQP